MTTWTYTATVGQIVGAGSCSYQLSGLFTYQASGGSIVAAGGCSRLPSSVRVFYAAPGYTVTQGSCSPRMGWLLLWKQWLQPNTAVELLTDATTGVPLTESQTEATMENAEIDSTTAAHKSAAATTAVLAQTGSSQCAVEETGSTTGTKD